MRRRANLCKPVGDNGVAICAVCADWGCNVSLHRQCDSLKHSEMQIRRSFQQSAAAVNCKWATHAYLYCWLTATACLQKQMLLLSHRQMSQRQDVSHLVVVLQLLLKVIGSACQPIYHLIVLFHPCQCLQPYPQLWCMMPQR